MIKRKKLSDLSVNKKAKVKQIAVKGQLRRKLLDMGIIPGSSIEVVKLAPLGDPVDVKIKGYHLSLRKEEASQILVEVVES